MTGRSVLIAALVTLWLAGVTVAQDFGIFLDELNVRLLSGGKVELLSDFRYRDPEGQIWGAPKGFVSDGASIPKLFWSIVGGPLDGDYRNAAVIHDRYCKTKGRSWRATHKAFFFAMRANGVSDTLARTMYYAVVAYGPRWATIERSKCVEKDGRETCEKTMENVSQQPEVTQADLEDVKKFRYQVQTEQFGNPARPLQNLDFVERRAIAQGSSKFQPGLKQ